MKNLYCLFRGMFGAEFEGRRIFLENVPNQPAPDADEGKARTEELAVIIDRGIEGVSRADTAADAKQAIKDIAYSGERAAAALTGSANNALARLEPKVDKDKHEADRKKVEASGLLALLRGQEGAVQQTAATPDLTAALAKLKGPTLPTEDQGVAALGSRGSASSEGKVIGIGGIGGSSARAGAEVRLAEGKTEPGKTEPLAGNAERMAKVDARIADQAAQTPEGRIAAQERVRAAAADTAYFDKAKNGLKVLSKLTLDGPLETADDGLIFQQLVIAAGGSFEKFKKNYVAANLKTGAQIEKFQRDWAKTNCGREDIYADIVQIKSDLHAETRIAVGKEKQPDKPLVRLGYEVAQALGLGAKPLTGAEVASVYGITSMPEGGKEFVFNPITKGISVVGADKTTALASFNLPKDTDTQRKEYLAQLMTRGTEKAPAASTVKPAVTVEQVLSEARPYAAANAAGEEEARRLAAQRAAHPKS